jgi:predicted phage tail protein
VPLDVRAIVTGRSVTLTWQPSPEATHYEIEAGSSPGLRTLARYVTGDTSFTAPDVPPGTYHVRVRALNYAGKGAYTHDLVITVP